jgi:hypothetical protein
MSAGLREVPCVVHRVDDEEARALAAAARLPVSVAAESKPSHGGVTDVAVANSLAAVLSCTDLLADTMPALTRAVAVEMIRAEARRATCMLYAARVLRSGVLEEHRLASPRQIVQRVADTVAADARLRGIRLETAVNIIDGALLRADEELLACGLSGVVLQLCGAVNRVSGARLTVSANAEPAGRVTFAVVQESVVVPETWLTIPAQPLLDSSESPALSPLLALRQIVEAYGGRLAISRLPRGSRVAVELPLQGSR